MTKIVVFVMDSKKYARDEDGFVIIDFTGESPAITHKKGPPDGFSREKMGNSSFLDIGNLPAPLSVDKSGFQKIWDLHPKTRHEIVMYGKKTSVPRYQQAYLRDYSFSGSVSKVLPLPDVLAPYLEYANSLGYSGNFNGFLINWYEAGENYIGSHADSTVQLVRNSPIITITLCSDGESRLFRIRDTKKHIVKNIFTDNGLVLTMGGCFQTEFKHEIVKTSKIGVSKRISITLRQFKE